jgi:hypothetical protein
MTGGKAKQLIDHLKPILPSIEPIHSGDVDQEVKPKLGIEFEELKDLKDSRGRHLHHRIPELNSPC